MLKEKEIPIDDLTAEEYEESHPATFSEITKELVLKVCMEIRCAAGPPELDAIKKTPNGNIGDDLTEVGRIHNVR